MGDLQTKVKGNLTAMGWKDKNVNTLTSMHSIPLEGNFCDKQGKAVKPATVQDYNRHKGYVKKSHHMTKFFLLTDLEMEKKAILPSPGPYHSQ
jgi:hypothetical protein